MTKVIEAQAQTERGHKGLSLGTFFCQALLEQRLLSQKLSKIEWKKVAVLV
jgi:hypothetical protein